MFDKELSLETTPGKAPGTRIVRLSGPLVLNNLFSFQDALRADPPPCLILDLSGVPYMDSSAMGAIINYYVSSQRDGRKFILVGVNSRIMELFIMTKVNGLLTMTSTLSDAESLV